MTTLVSVQEPCILAMLRIAADCEELPMEVVQTVSETGQNAGRHIRRVSGARRSHLTNIDLTHVSSAVTNF
jgi:hypothetical protein